MVKRFKGRDDGANLVEFAILAPLLILLVLGIVEFGWLFSQNNDVKHGAREGARAAAVNLADTTGLRTVVCDSMDTASNVTVEFTGGGGVIGDTATVTVIASPSSLSGLGLMEALMPDALTSSIDFRLEQPSTWTSDTGPEPCP